MSCTINTWSSLSSLTKLVCPTSNSPNSLSASASWSASVDLVAVLRLVGPDVEDPEADVALVEVDTLSRDEPLAFEKFEVVVEDDDWLSFCMWRLVDPLRRSGIGP